MKLSLGPGSIYAQSENIEMSTIFNSQVSNYDYLTSNQC